MDEMNAGMTVREIIDEVGEEICDRYCRFAHEASERCHEAETKAKDQAELVDMLDAISDEMFQAHCKGCPLNRL